MRLVNVNEAQTQFSKLLEQVQAGEDVIITKAGIPIVRLVPYVQLKRKIAPPGAMEGEIWIADDFDEPIDELFDCLKDDAA